MTKDTTNTDNVKPESKKPFVKPEYLRPWEIELTEEQKENVRKSIKEDEKRFKRMRERMQSEEFNFSLYKK